MRYGAEVTVQPTSAKESEIEFVQTEGEKANADRSINQSTINKSNLQERDGAHLGALRNSCTSSWLTFSGVAGKTI
jgi:hypothetical protein